MSVGSIDVRDAQALAAGQGAPDLRREFLRALIRQKTFMVGAFILAFWIFCAIFGQSLTPHSPYAQNLLSINQAPSGSHWFGTDQLGRDMFARVIAGSRDIMITAPLATALGTIVGTAIGLVMGYFRGPVDDVISRFVEAFLALPLVVTGILGVVALGASNATLIIVIGIVFAPLIARTVRAAVLMERELDYVQAAKLRGESSLYIMFVEILPNVMAPIMVEFTVRLGYAVFTLVTLSFLGFGLGPPSPNWGSDIQSNFGVIDAGYWWEVLFDVVAIATLVIGINMLANSIEAALEDQ
ncbi:MAG TPA: ABC transporter permease [Solirubrobacteraceae bacterium]|nr:ABC transporter permease [Solirubrobacteraceae bacterium]